MGFFSKLFGKDSEGVDKLADMFGSEKHYFDNLRHDDAPEPPKQPRPQKNGEQPPQRGYSPWGPLMPVEENQYSFQGSYTEYFSKVFAEEFPEYAVTCEDIDRRGSHRVVYTFRRNDRVQLIVELLSETSSTRTLRNECLRNGTPYLRFYYNHHGWWNARSYVAGRVRSKLGV